MYSKGDKITIVAGLYRNRPGVVRNDNGDDTYLVTLTDTPGPHDVTIKKVRPDQMKPR